MIIWVNLYYPSINSFYHNEVLNFYNLSYFWSLLANNTVVGEFANKAFR